MVRGMSEGIDLRVSHAVGIAENGEVIRWDEVG